MNGEVRNWDARASDGQVDANIFITGIVSSPSEFLRPHSSHVQSLVC